MASFSTNTATPSVSNPSSNIAGRELNLIASSFVKQYYTLLNKAPCYIHNFYSQCSTFIHGTIEMANEHFTEPIVGREKIQSKMEEMKLNDCRAKIKQIDCLETLAGGLVIQVIGELSNNGKPMRRFLQTFVLAPSPDEARQDGKDPAHQRSGGATDPRRGVHLNENNASPSNNQKFFVLNSIFRYQDDGQDSESEDDAVANQTNTSVDVTNNAGEHVKEVRKSTQTTATLAQPPLQVTPTITAHAKNQQASPTNEVESRRSDVVSGGARIVPNGTGLNDKKNETSEKSNENGKSVLDQSSQQSINSSSSAQGVQTPALSSSSAAASQSKPINTTTTTTSTPTNAAPSEPKTWANMVSKNAHPPSASVQSTASATKSLHPDQLHQNQSSQQQSLQQQQSHHQHQTPSDQPNSQNNNHNNSNNNNNNNNNRRRHMLRKPSNKSNGGASGGRGDGSNRGDGGGRGDGGRGDGGRGDGGRGDGGRGDGGRGDGGRGEGSRGDGGRGDGGRGDGGSRLKNRDRPRPPPAGKPMA